MTAIDARHRVLHVRAAALVEDVVEERAKLRANQIGRRVGECLRQLFKVELGREEAPEVVDDLQRVGVLSLELLRAHRLGDVLHDAQHPDHSAVFTVRRVTARGDPFVAGARANAIFDVVVAPARDSRIDGSSSALAIIGVQTFTQVRPGDRGPRRQVEDDRGAGRKGHHVRDSVPTPVAEPRRVERKPQPFGVGVVRRHCEGMIDHRSEPTRILPRRPAGRVTPAVLRERARVPDEAFHGRSAW